MIDALVAGRWNQRPPGASFCCDGHPWQASRRRQVQTKMIQRSSSAGSSSSAVVFTFCSLCNLVLLLQRRARWSGEQGRQFWPRLPTDARGRFIFQDLWTRSNLSPISIIITVIIDHYYEQRERRAPVPRRQSSGAAPSSAAAGLNPFHSQVTQRSLNLLKEKPLLAPPGAL